MEDKDKPKIPMYYEQIHKLMETMTQCSLQGKGFSLFKTFKDLFARVSFKLPKDRRDYYESMIQEITDKYIPIGDKYFKLCPRDQAGFFNKNKVEIQQPLSKLQRELFEDMNKAGIFDYLEKYNLDLGGR